MYTDETVGLRSEAETFSICLGAKCLCDVRYRYIVSTWTMLRVHGQERATIIMRNVVRKLSNK